MQPRDAIAPPWFVVTLPLTRAAFDYAQQMHRGQRRESDFAPFILHPLEVAMQLYNRGFPDAVIAAGLLHDIVEDTDASIEELEERFGPDVARLVAALTDDATIEDDRRRKAALREQIAHAPPEARAIYAADKVAKARELRATLTRAPDETRSDAIQRRLEHYALSLEELERDPPDDALVTQLRFELWALEVLPPRG